MKQLTRRTILAAAPALALGAPFLAARPARAAKKYGPGVTDTEIKIGNTGPYSGPASSYGTVPKSQAAYLQDDQRPRRHQRAQDQLHLLRRWLYAAQDRRDGAQTGRAGQRPPGRQSARHPDQQRDLALHEPEEGAAAVRRHRRHQMGRPKGPSVDDRLAAELSERRPHLCRLHPEREARRQDRRALSERRFRQGLPEGPDRRARCQGRR